MVRVDLHVHTSASFDSRAEPEEVAARALSLGLSPLFVTDHETIDGAIQLRDHGFSVVVGQEVTTKEGEIIGLFLQSALPTGLGVVETVKRIKDQGGLVYLEHPFDMSRRALSEKGIEAVLASIDIVEIFNGRSSPELNARAETLRSAIGAAPGIGSDAHSVRDLGHCYMELPEFTGSADFLLKLPKARIVHRSSPWRMRLRALAARPNTAKS